MPRAPARRGAVGKYARAQGADACEHAPEGKGACVLLHSVVCEL